MRKSLVVLSVVLMIYGVWAQSRTAGGRCGFSSFRACCGRRLSEN